jgi:Immunity protein 53
MSALSEIQEWYRSQCKGEWEHGGGITIATLDNPGWSIEVSLAGTGLEAVPFQERSYGTGQNAEPSGEDWLVCKVEEKKFKGFGGPYKLGEMIRIFLAWAAQNGEPTASPNGGPATRLGNSGVRGGPPSVS